MNELEKQELDPNRPRQKEIQGAVQEPQRRQGETSFVGNRIYGIKWIWEVRSRRAPITPKGLSTGYRVFGVS